MSYFVVSGTIDVIKYRSRQPSLGEKPKVVKVVAIAQSHSDRELTEKHLIRVKSHAFVRQLLLRFFVLRELLEAHAA